VVLLASLDTRHFHYSAAVTSRNSGITDLYLGRVWHHEANVMLDLSRRVGDFAGGVVVMAPSELKRIPGTFTSLRLYFGQ